MCRPRGQLPPALHQFTPKIAPTDKSPDAAPLAEGELVRLELRVARRADSLWRDSGGTKGSDLIHWLQAENEILGRYLADDHPAEAMAEAQKQGAEGRIFGVDPISWLVDRATQMVRPPRIESGESRFRMRAAGQQNPPFRRKSRICRRCTRRQEVAQSGTNVSRNRTGIDDQAPLASPKAPG